MAVLRTSLPSRPPSQSARGLAHSKTLRAIRASPDNAPASWTAAALRRFHTASRTITGRTLQNSARRSLAPPIIIDRRNGSYVLPMMVTGGAWHYFCLFFGLHETSQWTNETSFALNEISFAANETSNGFNKTLFVVDGVRKIINETSFAFI